MKKQSVIRSLKWVGVIVLGGVLFTGCKPDPDHKAGLMFDLVAYKLDLSDEQEVKWFAVRDEIKRLRDEARIEKQAHRQTLIDLVESDEMDQDQVFALFQLHQQKMAAVAPGVIEKLAEFHQTLNPDQKAKIVHKIESHAMK